CIVKHLEFQPVSTCPECSASLSQKEIRDLTDSWEKASFRIDIENISQITSSSNGEPNEVNANVGAATGDFYVVLLNGEKLTFQLESIKTVLSLREAIKSKTNVEVSKQKLIHNGKELNVCIINIDFFTSRIVNDKFIKLFDSRLLIQEEHIADNTWAVYEVGKLSNGNAKDYSPIIRTIGTLDQFLSI
ncbi:3583_t:CDS:2, partial [Cetraspora pellucida]